MVEMYVEKVADASRFADKCAMNRVTELTLDGRNKGRDWLYLLTKTETSTRNCKKVLRRATET